MRSRGCLPYRHNTTALRTAAQKLKQVSRRAAMQSQQRSAPENQARPCYQTCTRPIHRRLPAARSRCHDSALSSVLCTCPPFRDEMDTNICAAVANHDCCSSPKSSSCWGNAASISHKAPQKLTSGRREDGRGLKEGLRDGYESADGANRPENAAALHALALPEQNDAAVASAGACVAQRGKRNALLSR